MRGGEQGIYKSDADPVQFYSTAVDQSISLIWPLAVLSSETFIQQTSQAQGLPCQVSSRVSTKMKNCQMKMISISTCRRIHKIMRLQTDDKKTVKDFDVCVQEMH